METLLAIAVVLLAPLGPIGFAIGRRFPSTSDAHLHTAQQVVSSYRSLFNEGQVHPQALEHVLPILERELKS